MLEAWLDFHRITLEHKCHGLSPAQLRRRAVPPSALSLLGLVRHMADVERNWFRRALAHEEAPPHYRSDQAPTGAFDHVDTADVEEAFATWRAECRVCPAFYTPGNSASCGPFSIKSATSRERYFRLFGNSRDS
jgi:hypothetical protein